MVPLGVMMKLGMGIWISIALALAGCQQAKPTVQLTNGGSEATVRKGVTLAAGTSARLEFLTSINPDCTPTGHAPTVRVLRPPQHGSLDVAPVQDYPAFVRGNARFSCNKVRVPGTLMTYRPQADFVGTDDFTYEIFTGGGEMMHYDITATVM